jgi:hypothetical protein
VAKLVSNFIRCVFGIKPPDTPWQSKNVYPYRNAGCGCVDGHAKGIITRNLKTGEIETHAGHAVLISNRWLWQRVLPVNKRYRQ